MKHLVTCLNPLCPSFVLIYQPVQKYRRKTGSEKLKPIVDDVCQIKKKAYIKFWGFIALYSEKDVTSFS